MSNVYELGTAVEYTAAIALGGHRVVAIVGNQATYADKDTSAHYATVRGITTGAVLIGNTATIQVQGPMSEPSWSWTPNEPIYLGSNGQLTQTVPTTGAIIQIAVADTATQIMIDRKMPIII